LVVEENRKGDECGSFFSGVKKSKRALNERESFEDEDVTFMYGIEDSR